MCNELIIDAEKILEEISVSVESYVQQQIDWSQFIPTLIATFLAFALTLLASYLYDIFKDRKSKKRIIKSIRNELAEIVVSIHEVKKILLNKNLCTIWVMPLKTYFWDAFLSTNELSLIADEAWYNDLLEIYHSIQEYNMWQKIRTDAIINHLDCDDIGKALLSLGDTILSKIDSLKLLDKEKNQ